MEYYEPEYSNDGIINISKVIHGYLNTFSNGYGTAAYCNIDVNCALGDNWENEKRAVSMTLVNSNTAFCTGCLINNTNEDFKPYYLTANHCLRGNTNTWIFRFKYWRPDCLWVGPSNWKSITGAILRANYALTDFALLELNTIPPIDYDLYYAGWDRTTTPAQNATSIHHPQGDAMKISYDPSPVIAIPWYNGGFNHWRAVFEQGIVQPGSSGAPLFNHAKKIIGQLHGNQNNLCRDNYCYCNQTPIGEYGRFDISWTGGGTNNSRLSNWLDPSNTGTTVLDGTESCPTTTLAGTQPTPPSTNKRVVCKEIKLQNVTVPSGTSLKLKATGGAITIDANTRFRIEAGARFTVE